MATYAFINLVGAITGPNGNIQIGAGAGVDEGGITVSMRSDRNTLTIAADGTGMNVLHSDTSASVTVRLLKTSPINQQLQAMYDADSSSSALWGQNNITFRDSVRGDHVTCKGVAFKKMPDIGWGKEGPNNDWAFDVSSCHIQLGSGSPALTIGGI